MNGNGLVPLRGLARLAGLLIGLALTFAVADATAESGKPSGAGEINSAVLSSFSPAIIPRQKWGAKPPLPGMTPQSVQGIVLHHTGVHTNPNLSIEAKMRGRVFAAARPGVSQENEACMARRALPFLHRFRRSDRGGS